MTRTGINSDFLDELRNKNDIVDVASKYLTLTRRGGNFWACCPFHHEKMPSLSFKHDSQIFKCFGCGEGGNVFSFIMKMENVDFMTAVEILCKNAGMQLPTDSDNEEMRKKKQERDRTYAILKATTEFYHNNLLKNKDSEQARYLKKRGFSAEMIDKFQIGASLNFDDLPKHLLRLNFKPEEMISAGVVGRGDNALYDFYGNRLIFPIFNGLGETVAYSGRSVVDSPNHTKYKNTAQTSVFNKSEILFAYNFVRELKKERMLDTVIVVEGHIDAIMCHQYGINNVVACMGTALTVLHAKKLKQLADNIILCLDGDSAGEAATYKAINILKEIGLNVKVVRLSNAKDPDEFIKTFGKESFVNMLEDAADCVDFVLTDSIKKYDLNSNLDKNKYINEALNYISKFSTPSEQEIYLNVVQKFVRIPIDVLRKTLHGSIEATKTKDEEIQTRNELGRNKFIIESKIMLLASILYKKTRNFDDLSGLFDSDDELSEIYTYLKNKVSENKDWTVSSLFDNFEIENNSLIDKVINYEFPKDSVYETFLSDTIKRVRLLDLQAKRERYKELMELDNSIDGKIKMLEKIKEIDIRINKEKK